MKNRKPYLFRGRLFCLWGGEGLTVIFKVFPSVKLYLPSLLFLFVFSSNVNAGLVEAHFSVKPILLEDYLKSSLPVNALWSFSAIDLDTGRQIINTGNARDISLIPGSLVKLFIMAAILDMNTKMGISMDTIIAADGELSNGKLKGNLYIKGSGNAFLSEKDMEKAVEEILFRGIQKISGDIIVDDSLFDTREWKARWNGPAYAPPDALGLDLHTVSVTVDNTSSKVTIRPPNETVRISFNPSGKPNIRQIDDFAYEISGKISDLPFIRKRFPLKDPAVYAGWTLRTILRKRGINHDGVIRRGKMPANAIEIYSIRSKAPSDIIKDTNINSINVVAENLLLLLGAKRFGPPGSIKKGILALREFLNNIGLPSREMVFTDGSGLSPDNRITSEYIAVFLKKVSEKPWFSTFYESLPRAGMEGTFNDIGYRNEHIRAKTGRLNNVYCLAGYVDRSNGSRIAFSYMVNVSGADAMEIINTTGINVLRHLSGD